WFEAGAGALQDFLVARPVFEERLQRLILRLARAAPARPVENAREGALLAHFQIGFDVRILPQAVVTAARAAHGGSPGEVRGAGMRGGRRCLSRARLVR